jgi:hypothetical protein
MKYAATYTDPPGSVRVIVPGTVKEQRAGGPGSHDDGFLIGECSEVEVSRLIQISGMESEGGRAVFHGTLQPDADSAFSSVESALHDRGLDVWLLDATRNRAAVVVAKAQAIPALLKKPLLNSMLLLATLATMTWAGALHHGVDILKEPARWTLGFPYALALLLILGVHEMGHYLVARRRGVQVTLPYFIPAPFFLGTFGAFIRMGGHVADRRAYFDVAVAGPLAGLAVAVLAVLVGISGETLVAGHGIGMMPSSSLLFAGLYKLAGGGLITEPTQLGPIAFAGWLGLVVTALNLAPLGQLDGGHIAYALFGRVRARTIGVAVIASMVAAGLFYSQHWLMWAIVAYFIAGVDHPVAKNEVAGIGPRRRALGYFALAILAAIVLPVPG